MAEAATAVQEARPLTESERKSLNDLLARDSQFQAPPPAAVSRTSPS